MGTRFELGRRSALLLAGTMLFGAAAGHAQDGSPGYVRVEEDWVIEIGQPDPTEESPQITTVISPRANLDGAYAVFELNHGTLTDYVLGGLQLQLWTGEEPRYCAQRRAGRLLNTPNETVTFTSAMSLVDGKVRFEVINGQSQTWGTFGRTGSLRVESATSLSSLDAYQPAESVRNSRTGFASNRVKKMWLKEVRYYTGGGLAATDTTERVVHQSGGG